MIYDASLQIESKVPYITISKIKNISQKENGYILNLGNDNITIRVPVENMNQTIQEIHQLGVIKNSDLYGKDITSSYYDITIRLENLEKIKGRYLELLKKSDSVDTTLRIEKEIERLQLEIESLKGQYQRLTHLKEFSTIVIGITVPISPGPIGWIFVEIYEGIKWLFVWE